MKRKCLYKGPQIVTSMKTRSLHEGLKEPAMKSKCPHEEPIEIS
jgi:hypothetical protein